LGIEDKELNQTEVRLETISPPYSPEDIVGSNHLNQIHKRQLQNAELMAKKGNLKSALEIYGRTLQRIKDPEASGKIKEIIDLIGNSYKKSENQSTAKQIPTSRGTNKLNFSKVLRDLSNVVSELSQNIQNQQDKSPPRPPVTPEKLGSDGSRESENRAFPSENYPQGSDPSIQTPGSSPNPGMQPTESTFPPQSVEPIQNQGYPGQGISPIPPQTAFPQAQGIPSLPPRESAFPPQPQSSGFPGQAISQQNLGSPPQETPPVAKPGEIPPSSDLRNGSSLPPQPPLGIEIKYPEIPSGSNPSSDAILNRLEILEELYNRKDWQDLKDLPLRDRRTGNDRRTEDIPVKNDRRDQDRRSEDLLEKRDEFVSDWTDSIEKGVIPPPPDQDQNRLTAEAPKPDTSPIPEKSPANEEYTEGNLPKINLPDPIVLSYDGFRDAPKRSMSLDKGGDSQIPAEEGLQTKDILFPTEKDAQVYEIFKINLPNPKDTTFRNREMEDDEDSFVDRDINIIDSPLADDEKIEEAMDNRPEVSIPEIQTESQEPPEPERIMHGILELKPPEVDDAPFLTLTYDFSKIPHSFRLSKNYSIMEYSYYKYKPMLMKAQEFARRKMLKNALNYYRVVRSQNIPPELKLMINRNVTDITEFLEKFVMSKGG
jgi:hypothetical protein